MNIGYLSTCDQDYSRLLTLQDTRAKLRKFTASYRRVADDAFQIALSMSLGDFRQFRDGLAKERRGRFAGEEWMKRFGDVLMPQVIFKVSTIACEFKVPWGLAFKRLIDVGHIVEDEDGIERLVKK